MNEVLQKEIERIFLNASCPNALFDTFQIALKNRISDPFVYQTLLANPALSKEEITLFAETYCKEFPDNAYEVYYWVGNILEQNNKPIDRAENAVKYYKKAIKAKPERYEPYINMLNLFNYEYDYEFNKTIIKTVDEGLKKVTEKKDLLLKLADHFRNLGNESKSKLCIQLANKDRIKNINKRNRL
ncbi:MAG: hypothetical protein V1773_09800 [bacterium]